MSTWRELTDDMDAEVFAALADDVTVNARPVRGIFSAPWLAPQLGRLNTAIVEPRLSVRDADAVGVIKGMPVVVDGLDYVVVLIEPDSTGITMLVLRTQ